jgi:hypothetical protein
MQKSITSMTEAPGANGGLSDAEVNKLIQRAEKGDKKALPALREWLDARPEAFYDYVDLAKITLDTLAKRVGNDKNLFVHEVLRRKCKAMRQELAGAEPSLLENLLAERIVICWLHLHYAEAIYAQHMDDLTLKQAEFHQQRITKAHSRYLSAIRTLAQVRRLEVPAVQVNIGDQQINVAQ